MELVVDDAKCIVACRRVPVRTEQNRAPDRAMREIGRHVDVARERELAGQESSLNTAEYSRVADSRAPAVDVVHVFDRSKKRTDARPALVELSPKVGGRHERAIAEERV